MYAFHFAHGLPWTICLAGIMTVRFDLPNDPSLESCESTSTSVEASKAGNGVYQSVTNNHDVV